MKLSKTWFHSRCISPLYGDIMYRCNPDVISPNPPKLERLQVETQSELLLQKMRVQATLGMRLR